MIAEVSAGQLIYTNVEEEQSPRKKGGWQTLFYTIADLTETEVEEVEARLLYFPSEREIIKRVFFTTSSGKQVIAQIIPLDDPDRIGRKGRYLAHSLVFAGDALAKIGADPFSVFQNFSFLISVEDALDKGDFQTGNIPPVVFEIPLDNERYLEIAETWSASELIKLSSLSLNADHLANNRSTVAIIGDPQQIESALGAAFFPLHASHHSKCSFDTYFYRCNLVATYYWAIGSQEQPNNPRFIVVDAQSRQVNATLEEQPKNSYEHWIFALIEARRLSFIEHFKEWAFHLCQWIDGNKYDDTLVDNSPPPVINSIFQVNTQQVKSLMQKHLDAKLPSILVSRILDSLHSQLDSIELFGSLRGGFELTYLLDLLHETYQNRRFQTPVENEVLALGELLQTTRHRPLYLLYACWTDQRKHLRRELDNLSDNEYQQFVEYALRFSIVEPLVLLISGRGNIFLNLYLGTQVFHEFDLVTLAQALLAAEEVDCLPQLIPYVVSLSGKELKLLEKVTKTYPDIPEEFQSSIEEAIAAIPPKGIKGALKSLFAPGEGESNNQ